MKNLPYILLGLFLAVLFGPTIRAQFITSGIVIGNSSSGTSGSYCQLSFTNAPQAVSFNVWTKILFTNGLQYSYGDAISYESNDSRMRALRTGKYKVYVFATGDSDTNPAGRCAGVGIGVNGAMVKQFVPSFNEPGWQMVAEMTLPVLALASNDFVEAYAYQAVSAPAIVSLSTNDVFRPSFYMEYKGP